MYDNQTMNPEHQKRLKKAAGLLRKQAIVLFSFVALFWGLEILDWTPFFNLDKYGIRPWDIDSLRHIFTAPFLHVGFGHVAANSIPFLVMGFFVMLRGMKKFLLATLAIIVVGGLGVWLTGGANTIHLGASIIVFGYFGFNLFNALFERSQAAMAITLVTVLMYGGLIWGIAPLQVGVSWQGHLFGFIGGALAAKWLSDQPTESLS